MNKKYEEWKFDHKQECSQLQQQLEEQSKVANEALQDKITLEKELQDVSQTLVAEQAKWRKDMANLQGRLDETIAQLEQNTEPAKTDISPWKVCRSDVVIVNELGVET